MRYRIYYNRGEEAPWIWSYDQGTMATETLLTEWRLHGCDVTSGRQSSDVHRTSVTEPHVWMDVDANLVKMDRTGGLGVAHFYGRWVDSGFPLHRDCG